MDCADAIHNPLNINLTRQIHVLLQELRSSPHEQSIQACSDHSQLLSLLSKLLADPALTLLIARIFRPILLDLCARWLELPHNSEDEIVALCLLVEVHEELFPILYRMLRRPPFQGGLLHFVSADVPLPSIPSERLHRLLLAYYRLLQVNRELPEQSFWPLSPLSALMWDPGLDSGIRMLAIQCYALQSGMGEAERISIEAQALGPPCENDCWIECGRETDGKQKRIDGWVMPLLEVMRVRAFRESIATDEQDFYSSQEDGSQQSISPAELSPYIADVHGILLIRDPPTTQRDPSNLVCTQTAIRSLRSLAIHISLRVPVLITSPPSCGKSLLLTHLASLLHPSQANQIITIHLADTSLDPRSLLGSYVSSPTLPGAFEWKDGTLVRAMKQGKWLVLEDIDRGSSEVLGVIKPLVKSLCPGKWIGGHASIEVPGHGKVVAAQEFAVFATRSVSPSKYGQFPRPTFFGSHKFHEITVPSPSSEELQLIVDTHFPRIAGRLALALIRLWRAVVEIGSSASTRDVGMRELEKFCQRVSDLLPPSFASVQIASDSLEEIFPITSIREEIFVEAKDVFFGAGTITSAARAHLDSIASIIGQHLGLDAERRHWALHVATPFFDIDKDANGFVVAVRAGRTRLLAQASRPQAVLPSSRPFALHKPAISLLSRIATAVSLSEPILLTGETGTGKTSVISYLASLLRRPLVSLNLSHQTESADLLGGFKPIDARIPATALHARFLELFGSTFSRKKNASFEESVRKAVAEENWKRCVALWKEATRLAKQRIVAKLEQDGAENSEAPRKRRKVGGEESLLASESQWTSFSDEVLQFEIQHVSAKGRFAFGFVEGPLVKAIRSGDWVLLDEVNLASPETLECISGLLHGPTASITLTEQGSLEPVPRHPDFRLFACMNPATDVGKKDLPPNIRARFTEFDVPSPDADRETLLTIINQYIGPAAVGDKAAIMNIAEFYVAVKQLAEAGQIADGSNHKPHFSMRTLARALTFAADITNVYGLRRALWEGCLMAFTMVLDSPSAQLVVGLAHKHLLAGVKNPRSLLAKEPSDSEYTRSDRYVKFGPFYLERGPLPEDPMEEYIMTPSVEDKLIDLARIILTRRFPVLIEGPTSSGKTSSVEYLARRTGHRFVRINNHEHTDIQEYIGSYVSDPTTGKFVFKDGLLVQALRNGYWIVLDELNLAPTDVLEALNRLLDDNRELVIPETHEVVRPHPHFMLFAAQNPPGLYAGRKVLSRAFRNRFLEVHYDDVPQSELETILCQRCQIPPSYGKKIVAVFRELQTRRQFGRVFDSKEGFATLRDLFRWAGRDAVGYQELAENGYMLLAERARQDDDKVVVKEVIESIMGVKIDPKAVYRLDRLDRDTIAYLGCPIPNPSQLAWTSAMQRLFILIARALRFNEPILLVGETGSGKTSICQLYAEALSQQLYMLNCHQNTETADLIGGLRPIRNRGSVEADVLREVTASLAGLDLPVDVSSRQTLLSAIDSLLVSPCALDLNTVSVLKEVQQRLNSLGLIFEWKDGPLIQAMRQGSVFLLDEISLADDSVLERLNSVLEPARTIVLAERGGDHSEIPFIKAVENFKLVATMNPGGDYGKKELSPALRNRFTEIWVPSVVDRSDLELIINSRWEFDILKPYTAKILDFTEWLCEQAGDSSLTSIRDLLAWVEFSNALVRRTDENSMTLSEVFLHAAQMTFLDGLGSLPQLVSYSPEAIAQLRSRALSKVEHLVPFDASPSLPYHATGFVRVGRFALPKGCDDPTQPSFNLDTPTTQTNAMRVIRACQVPKPILLEGSPGVGKTTLITALAALSGHKLCRINLSDQTDLIDLFGSDLPVDGGKPGEFSWKDAEFLRAMQDGHWVLLDEMNLAPQAVLEGLNAALDHRGAVYIPELGRTFTRHPTFRIFAAQNPLSQGGGRKGLPKSFINRFTKVYVDEHTPEDLLLTCQLLFPSLDEDLLRRMIAYNTRLALEVTSKRTFAREGAPWEFNLRDILRWCSLVASARRPPQPLSYLNTIYLHRFRTQADQERALAVFEQVFHWPCSRMGANAPHPSLSSTHLQIGHATHIRHNFRSTVRTGRLLQCQLAMLESLGHCVQQNWLAILTGPQDSGKTEVVKLLADISGNQLRELAFNSATDTTDILGSFEQLDAQTYTLKLLDAVMESFRVHLRTTVGAAQHLSLCYQQLRDLVTSTSPSATTLQAVLTMVDDLPSDGPIHKHGDAIREHIAQIAAQTSAGRFVWVDGPLVQAAKEGSWLLIQGANLCNPSVLDRLNSLCEHNGELMLSERGFVNGAVQIVKPHPNFRLFMSVDPHFGELSRAMRNRGVEISFSSTPNEIDKQVLQDFLRLPKFSPTTGSVHHQFASFDLQRRGVLPAQIPLALLPTPFGSALDHHTCLMNIADPLAVELRATATNFTTDDVLFFHTHTHSVAHLSYTVRAIDALGDECNLSKLKSLSQSLSWTRLDAYIGDMQQLFAEIWGTAIGVATHQRIDALANVPILDEVTTPLLSLLFCALDVCTTLFQHEEIKFPTLRVTPGRSARPLIDIESSISKILDECRKFMNSFDEGFSPEETTNLHVVHSLLRHCIRLRRVAYHQFFDHSAAHTIVNTMVDIVRVASSRLQLLIQTVTELNAALSPTSGLGLMDIWTSFSFESTSEPLPAAADQLALLASQLGLGDRELRHAAFDLIAVQGLYDLADNTSLSDMAAKLKEHLSHQILLPDSSTHHTQTAMTALVTELTFHSAWPSSGANTLRTLRTLIDLNCGTDLRHYIPYQHILWATQADKSILPIMARLCVEWHQSLWDLTPYHNLPNGPSILLAPTLLVSSVSLCRWDSNPLGRLEDYRSNLRSLSELIAIHLDDRPARLQQLHQALNVVILMVCSCFASSYPGSVLQELRQSFGPEMKLEAHQFLRLLDQTNNVVLKEALKTFIHPLISHLDTPGDSGLSTMGSTWIAIGRMILHLSVPDTPIDPVAKYNFMKQSRLEDIEGLSQQISLHNRLESAISGNPTNASIKYLTDQLNVASADLSSTRKCPDRNDPSRILILWQEVYQFQHQVISPSKLDPLVEGIMCGAPGAADAEIVVQQSIAGFMQRLDSAYAEYSDINIILKLAFASMRFGLRLISHTVNLKSSDNEVTILATALVAFPSAKSSSLLLESASTTGGASLNGFRHILLNLAAIASQRHHSAPMDTLISLLQDACSQALRMWLIDRARETEADRASQSLYRAKNEAHMPDSDAEIEEKEFLALFPSFEDAFDSTPRSQESTSEDLVDSQRAHHFVAIFRDLLLAPSSLTSFDSLRKEALNELLRSASSTLPHTLDNNGRVLLLSLLHDGLAGASSSQSTVAYNFYADANVPEASRSITVIRPLIRQLNELSQQWPDQMVLQDLKRRCEVLLELDIRSPIAKLLVALEQILIQSEDWEMYASRETSLKPHQQAITSLIVQWRRLELSAWHALLEAESTASADSSSVWWFRLYNALVHGALDAVDSEEGMATYLRDLIPLLEDFIRSSPLGQYLARMSLLKSFIAFTMLLASSFEGRQRESFEQILRVVYHVTHSHDLYTEQLSELIKTQRTSLEREIKDLIKLASWKDINVHALRQSARRSHYQLFKLVRKFRELLRQPIVDRLTIQMASPSNIRDIHNGHAEVPDTHTPSFPILQGSTLPHLANLDRTFSRFQALVHSRIIGWHTDHQAEPVNDLAIQVITTATELASTSIPADNKSDVRVKHQKALLVRKRKAWSDLLKELKRVGLSSAVQADILHRQLDPFWMHDQPILSTGTISTSQSCETYFWRLSFCLPELRKSIVSHHPDLNTRELQRGLMLVESGFSIALSARRELAGSCGSFKGLNAFLRRLNMLASCPTVVTYGPSVSKVLLDLRILLSKVESALAEMTEALEAARSLTTTTTADLAAIVDRSRELTSITKDLNQSLAPIIESVNLTQPPLLLEDESEFVASALVHLGVVNNAIGQWRDQQPILYHIFDATLEWLSSHATPSLPPKPSSAHSEAPTDNIINSILVIVQDLLTQCPQSSEETESDRDRYIREDIQAIQKLSRLLDLDGMVNRLSSSLVFLAARSHHSLIQDLQRLLPFLELYVSLAKAQLELHGQWLRSLLKLDYIVCSVVHKLATQGFCKPQDVDEGGGEGESLQMDGGVGLGDGTGSENVSKEIEEEHQVEGLQGEDANTDKTDAADDPNAIEMSDDVGGEMEDVPDPGSEGGEESDDESKEEPDEQLGKLDKSDPSAVDEKLWGDEEGPELDPDDDKIDQDRSQNASSKSEVMAKESGSAKKEKEEPEQQKSPIEGDQPEGVEEEQVEDNLSQGEPPGADGAPMDNHVQDADTLDLPDDLQLDPEEADNGEMELDEDDLPEETEVDALPGGDEDHAMDDDDSTGPQDAGGDAAQADGEGAAQDETEDDVASQADEQTNQAVAAADVSSGDGYANEEQSHAVDRGEASSATQTAIGRGSATDPAPQQDQAPPPQRENQNSGEVAAQNDSQASGDASSGSQQGPAPAQETLDSSQDPIPNPHRSLSDAVRDIQRRLDPILEGSKRDAPIPQPGGPTGSKQVEYLHPEDEDLDMDALGPAGDDQAAQLDKLKLVDGNEEDAGMDVDSDPIQERDGVGNQGQEFEGEKTSTSHGMDIDAAVVSGPRMNAGPGESTSFGDSTNNTDSESTREEYPLVEAQLREWQSRGQPEYGAEHIWRLYESLTSDLSLALCEQLRLILEPTLATRLKGDYRTGKRLNMKKVIAYIASDYTKDKIWLRRTRPSQREYQVLIALDDSKSMAESHSVHLAFQTLALVSKSLTRLEAGDIGIAKFGEKVDLLHGFDEGPFSDQTGTRVISSFKFNQKATNVLSLIQQSLQVLEHARERRSIGSSTSADLWQLEIIVSDGICQDHEQLRTVLRKAVEQRVMIVFIIIDSLHPPSSDPRSGMTNPTQNSILSMEKAAFKSVDGRMELQLERYMDSFPFEYYVVLRSVEALPDVLASTLKQFFERISGQ